MFQNQNIKNVNVLTVIMVLGSLWGFSEVVLNEIIKSSGIPFRGGLLVGFGMFILGISMGVVKRTSIMLLLPFFVAILLQMGIPILGISDFCRPNSCVAIGLQAFALAGAVGFAGKRLKSNRIVQVVAGACAGLISAGIFYFIGLRVAPCPYLLSFNHAGGFAKFMVFEGLVWAAFAAIFYPVGFWAGEKIKYQMFDYATKRPVIYFSTVTGIVVSSWFTIAVTFAISG